MAALEKIRVKFGWVISIIIALALLSFIIDPGTLQSALSSMSSKYDVGKIAGKRISYTDYQENVDKFTNISEIVRGTSAQNEQVQKEIRDAAWQDLLDKYMFVKNARNAGIKVGEEELISLLSSQNPSPVIAQNGLFIDETGNFSDERLKDFINFINTDENGSRYRSYWDYLQNTVYNQQFYQKYGALFNSSSYVNSLEMNQALAANNTTVNLDYCLVYYPMTQDSTVQVSSSEIRNYYKAHKEFFKRNKDTREMEYVVFEVVPSSDDINKTSLEMDDLYEEFSTTSNMKSFLSKNSESPLSGYWYKDGELKTLSAELNDQIFGGREVSQVVKNGNDFYAARTLETKNIPDSVYVKHILLEPNSASTADSLVNVIRKGANFSNLVSKHSLDQNSSADGELGNIGWMTQTYMISGMESVMEAQVGKPFVLNTDYGTHVVLVSKATKPVLKKQVAVLKKTAVPSRETYNSYYAQANRFAGIAEGKYEGYLKAVDSLKLYSHNLTVTEATSNYGAIDQAKAVTRWVFDNKPGKASSIITVNNNYFFVATVKSEKKAGYMPVEEVASTIQNRLYSEKIQKKTMEEVKAKLNGVSTIEAAAEALNVSVEHNEALSLSSGSIDPAVLGAASVAADGQLYGPVAGSMGVYVVKVSDKQTGSFYTETDARNLALQKSQYMAQMILSVMSNYDEVVDNRERFY